MEEEKEKEEEVLWETSFGLVLAIAPGKGEHPSRTKRKGSW